MMAILSAVTKLSGPGLTPVKRLPHLVGVIRGEGIRLQDCDVTADDSGRPIAGHGLECGVDEHDVAARIGNDHRIATLRNRLIEQFQTRGLRVDGVKGLVNRLTDDRNLVAAGNLASRITIAVPEASYGLNHGLTGPGNCLIDHPPAEQGEQDVGTQ